ncbi:GDSL-type esterase/lipase family protein [Chondrinema litorale]|uniref:GDSL-type esterase/lipase family protein n=1 Tax=Chondrinema litorale TaxID=2994555 RepID=UPI002543A347|nr:GDSL-type esterase/lipase family protein [Chondrinema litorale]UZR98062.1 GDSL-type esterase/lipase family protein [Chondrinema litorale]
MWKKIVLSIIGILLIGSGWMAYLINNEFEKLESDNPNVWEDAIRQFEVEDKSTNYPKDAVLFVGSSSIRFWNTLKEDMAPIPVIKRGFGGAKLNDVIHFADRIIFPYQPKKIVLFAGTNDLSGRPNDKTPEQILADFVKLIDKIHRELPKTEIYYLPITPTNSRWEIWPQAKKANQLIQTYAQKYAFIHFIETSNYFINKQGKLIDNYLWFDGIHLNTKGYQLWTKLIKEKIQFQGKNAL